MFGLEDEQQAEIDYLKSVNKWLKVGICIVFITLLIIILYVI